MRFFSTIVLCVVLACGYAQQFRFENFSVNSGLPQSQVYCELQDHNGFLWLGTMGGGVAKFDGRNFTTFTTRDGLPNNFVHCLFQYENILWIGTQKGLCYYDGLSIKKLNDTTFNNKQVISFYKDDQVTIVGTSDGLYTASNNNSFVNRTALFGVTKAFVATITKGVNDTYWIGGSQGIFRYTPQSETKYKRYTRNNGLGTNDVECFQLLPDSSLLIGTYGAGLYVLKNDKIQRFYASTLLGNEIVHDLYLDDKLWIGTQRKGLYVMDLATNEVARINQGDGLANNHIRCILKDDWGTYWIGTSGGGVSKYFGQSFVHYTSKKGLPGNYIYSIFKSSKEELWLGVSDKGLVRKDSIGFTVYGADSGFVNEKVKALAEDNEGRLWIGTVGRGVYTYDGKSFTQIQRKNGIQGRFIKDLEYDGQSMWYASIDQGISRLFLGKGKYNVRQYSLANGLQSDRINALCFADGKMWYGCQSKGVGYITKGNIVDLSKAGFPEWAVRSMKADAAGNIWVATGGSGIIRIYKDGAAATGYSYKEYGYDNGMLSTNVYSVLVDGNTVYCGSENGIDELTINEQFDVIEAQHYGYDEGFVGVETCQDAVSKDANGNVWFGTINGLSQYKPNSQTTNARSPKLSFSDIRANLSQQIWKANNVFHYFKPDQNTVSFEFVGVDLGRPKSVEYSYKLEGTDLTWSIPSSGNSVRYANLRSGDYSFHLRATSDGVHWSETKMYNFEIATAFYKTWWFWLLCIAVLAAVVWFAFRYRISTLKKKAEEENLKYQMKNDLLQLEQKALRLQMNPHFLFNALNSIQGLIIKNDQKSARYYLAKFAHLMRQILDNSRTGSISLEEELKTLENYLLIEKLSKKDNFEYSISVAESINQNTLQLPPMLVQPFVENAIIHAFTGKEDKGEIRIEIEREDAFLKITIQDNGIGRLRAGEISKQGINRQSVGIEVTEQRLKAHNGDVLDDTIKIEDMMDEKGAAKGTKISLKIRIDE